MKKISKLAISILVCQGAGIIGSIFTVASIPTWYAGLTKPSFNPSSWIFGPVWAILYLLMGVALWLVWKSDSAQKIKAIWLFTAQLTLNALWSIIFFGLRSPFLAFVEIIVLWLAILGTIIVFSKISRLAMFFLLPYILWVSFAVILNYSIWQLNY